MTGANIRVILKEYGYELKEIACSMGVSQQQLNSFFQSEDIKTGVVARIAKAIKKSPYFFYCQTSAIDGGFLVDSTFQIDCFEKISNEKDKRIEELIRENERLRLELGNVKQNAELDDGVECVDAERLLQVV